jgi:hypothetical protein
VKWFPDQSGRFAKRPHFEPAEIDALGEDLSRGFHQGKYGRPFAPPWRTEDLATLIEQHADSLDLYADLESREGPGVEGITWFVRGRGPKVEISAALSAEPRYERRLRTTLTHECTHVVLHGPLWKLHWEQLGGPSLFPELGFDFRSVSRRGGRAAADWMEWQAGYGCGAILMPKLHLVRVATEARRAVGVRGDLTGGTPEGDAVVSQVANQFQASREAARVRLEELHLLRPAGLAAQGSLDLDQ